MWNDNSSSCWEICSPPTYGGTSLKGYFIRSQTTPLRGITGSTEPVPRHCFAQRKEERLPILHSLQPGIRPPSYPVAFIAPFHVIQINPKILVERFVCFIMAEGIVGLAFGVSGVFALVDQCLILYRHIDEARTFGENVWQQYVLFQHECARFNSWQKEMRDFHVVTRPSLPNSSLSTGLETPNADDLMHNTLAQIISILEAVQSLCRGV